MLMCGNKSEPFAFLCSKCRRNSPVWTPCTDAEGHPGVRTNGLCVECAEAPVDVTITADVSTYGSMYGSAHRRGPAS